MNAKISILFYAKKAKASNNGLIPIYMRITVDGKRLEISSKRFVQSGKWNHDQSRMKGNSEEARSVNGYLPKTRHGSAMECDTVCRARNLFVRRIQETLEKFL